MAHYSYKDVVYDIPQEYFERFEKLYGRECDNDPNYDGDYWTLVSWCGRLTIYKKKIQV